MKNTHKATLLSALVIPGAGHVYLKKYVSGVILCGISLIAMSILIQQAVIKASAIVEKILTGDIEPNIQVITKLVTASDTDGALISYCTYTIIVCWAIGVIDSYRLGKKQESLSESKGSKTK